MLFLGFFSDQCSLVFFWMCPTYSTDFELSCHFNIKLRKRPVCSRRFIASRAVQDRFSLDTTPTPTAKAVV